MFRSARRTAQRLWGVRAFSSAQGLPIKLHNPSLFRNGVGYIAGKWVPADPKNQLEVRYLYLLETIQTSSMFCILFVASHSLLSVRVVFR